MKKHLTQTGGLLHTLLIACILAALALLLVAPPGAPAQDQQGYANTITTMTNTPTTTAGFTNAAGTVFSYVLTNTFYSGPSGASAYYTVTNYLGNRAKSGLGFQNVLIASTGTGPEIFYLYPTYDGTNFAIVPFASITNTANGTTPVVTQTNFTELQLRGIVGFNVGVTNGTGGWTTNLPTFTRPNLQ